MCNAPFALAPVLALGLVVWASPLVAGPLYRWVDDQGNVQFSDRIPSDQVDQERTRLNARGLEVGKVEAAKTPEEIALERAEEELRKEQKRLIAKQKAEDEVLLRTFQSDADIIMARDGKLAAVDSRMQMTFNSADRVKGKLYELQKRAADLERQGKPLPDDLKKSIAEARSSLEERYRTMLDEEASKVEIQKRYDADLKRFRELRNIKAPEGNSDKKVLASVDELPNVFVCQDDAACDTAWGKAAAFVKEFSGTPTLAVSDELILSAPPTEDTKAGLTISRMKTKSDGIELLFLDVQCKNSAMGTAHCRSQEIQLLKGRFQAYLNVRDGT